MAGSPDGTRPSAGGAASGAAGTASGSALAEGATVAEMTTQTAKTTARRRTLALGITTDTVSAVGLKVPAFARRRIDVVVRL